MHKTFFLIFSFFIWFIPLSDIIGIKRVPDDHELNFKKVGVFPCGCNIKSTDYFFLIAPNLMQYIFFQIGKNLKIIILCFFTNVSQKNLYSRPSFAYSWYRFCYLWKWHLVKPTLQVTKNVIRTHFVRKISPKPKATFIDN